MVRRGAGRCKRGLLPGERWPQAAAAALGLRAAFGAALKSCVFLRGDDALLSVKRWLRFRPLLCFGFLGLFFFLWGEVGLEFLCLEPSKVRPSTGGCPSALTATAAAARRAAEPGGPG